MALRICQVIVVLAVFGVVHAQSPLSASPAVAISDRQIARRIFDAEQVTIAAFAKGQPIVETYLQSLTPETSAEAPMDDAYFLGRVDLNPDSSRRNISQRLLFGNIYEDREVRVSSGQRWPLTPDGFVTMLFPDVTNFDEDDYDLTNPRVEALGNTNCIRLSVLPKSPRLPGDFVGDIWAETSNFHIVRLQGTFVPKRAGFVTKHLNVRGYGYLGMYLHFDSWREEVAPGVWLPSRTYFDETRSWGSKTGDSICSFHYRGHVLAWGYQGPPPEVSKTIAENGAAPATGPALMNLEMDKILATSGEVEATLNSIVRELRVANNVGGPDIDCRVLLTTPVELFNVHNTIFISRGLLNLLPGRSVLTGLLATELAHIVLGNSMEIADTSSLFSRKSSDFRGLGLRRSEAEEVAAATEVNSLLNHPQYRDTISETDTFLPRPPLLEDSARLHDEQMALCLGTQNVRRRIVAVLPGSMSSRTVH